MVPLAANREPTGAGYARSSPELLLIGWLSTQQTQPLAIETVTLSLPRSIFAILKPTATQRPKPTGVESLHKVSIGKAP